MKLIASLTSPFARKVRVVLAEKKIDCPLELDMPWEAGSRVAEFNPLGKVPVLLLDDGSTLFDSRVIVEYLDSISPVARLFPQERRQLIEARRWEALADGICDAAANIVIEQRRPPALQSADWINRQHDKVIRGLAALAHDLGRPAGASRPLNGRCRGLAGLLGLCRLGLACRPPPERSLQRRQSECPLSPKGLIQFDTTWRGQQQSPQHQGAHQRHQHGPQLFPRHHILAFSAPKWAHPNIVQPAGLCLST